MERCVHEFPCSIHVLAAASETNEKSLFACWFNRFAGEEDGNTLVTNSFQICMCSRAIQYEINSSLTKDTFLQ